MHKPPAEPDAAPETITTNLDNTSMEVCGLSAAEANVSAMINKMRFVELFADAGSLRNQFTGKEASKEEERGMLEHGTIGKLKQTAFFESRLMHLPSVAAPVHMTNLRTMSARKKRKPPTKASKPNTTMVLALKAQLLKAEKQKLTGDTAGQQYCLLPSALVDKNGMPRPPTKSNMRKVNQGRYPDAFSHSLPRSFASHRSSAAVILDGMFLIQTAPLTHHKLYADYILFILSRWVLSKFAVADNVHLLFDDPGRHGASPKDIERQRRDMNSEPCTADHAEPTLLSQCPPAGEWRRVLSCRQCKRNLVRVLSKGCILLMQVQPLQPGQKLVTAGGFDGDLKDQAWQVGYQIPPSRAPQFDGNHEECDTRVWLHSTHFTHALIYSPDTDTFLVGLPLITSSIQADVVVQLNRPQSMEKLYVFVNDLKDHILRDPDLAFIPAADRTAVLQAVYAASGCDYTSAFCGMGKASFMKVLYQHCDFISGDGIISRYTSQEDSFLAFIRLVVCTYYNRHRSAFTTTPVNLFVETCGPHTTSTEKHRTFLDGVRKVVWSHTTKDEDNVPTWSALHLHWLRTTWVLTLWGSATVPSMQLPSLQAYGWALLEDNTVRVVWDTEESLKAIEDLLNSLTAGCRCKTGCATRRCKCVKAGNQCTATCRCKNCTHRPPDDQNDQVQEPTRCASCGDESYTSSNSSDEDADEQARMSSDSD